MKLVLASKSKARIDMLRAAGLSFEPCPADIDESAAQNSDAPPPEIAANLAAQKALSVAAQMPDVLVIGSDQVLECGGQLLTKAMNSEEARAKLQTLRGRMHHLISAVCVARGDEILWTHTDKAALTMRDFDDEFLQKYLEQAGGVLTSCVGAYALEEIGVRLFEKIEGDYFTILGMPLLPLLTYLQDEQGVSL